MEQGTYSTGTGMPSTTNCTNCCAGRYSTAVGLSDPGGCVGCALGYYTNTPTGGTGCVACGANTYQPFINASGPNFCASCRPHSSSPVASTVRFPQTILSAAQWLLPSFGC